MVSPGNPITLLIYTAPGSSGASTITMSPSLILACLRAITRSLFSKVGCIEIPDTVKLAKTYLFSTKKIPKNMAVRISTWRIH